VGQLELNLRCSSESIVVEHVISLLKADFSEKFSAYVEFFKLTWLPYKLWLECSGNLE
jgi:hypothetical protein